MEAPLPGLDLRELALPWSVVQHDYSSRPSQVPTQCRARLWSRRQAAQRYRASEQGKERRRRQACRYREPVRKRREEALLRGAEGHQEAADSGKIPCSRPGCYERFPPERRSPRKKFCCALCREALRRVRQREARWGVRDPSLCEEDRWERFHGSPEGFR